MNVMFSMIDSVYSIKSGQKERSGQIAKNSNGNSEPIMIIHFSLPPPLSLFFKNFRDFYVDIDAFLPGGR